MSVIPHHGIFNWSDLMQIVCATAISFAEDSMSRLSFLYSSSYIIFVCLFNFSYFVSMNVLTTGISVHRLLA